MHKAVIFGMYPELEEASKEFYRKCKDIYNELKNNPHQDGEILSDYLKKLSFQIGEQYGLNKNRYLFNEMSEEQTKRFMQRKDIEIKNMCKRQAEAMIEYLNENPENLASLNMFGRPLKDMLNDGINSKLSSLPENCKQKLQKALKIATSKQKSNIIVFVF